MTQVLNSPLRQILIRTSECFPSSDILQDYLFSRWVMPRHSGFVGRGDKLRVFWFLGLYPFKNQHLNIKPSF